MCHLMLDQFTLVISMTFECRNGLRLLYYAQFYVIFNYLIYEYEVAC